MIFYDETVYFRHNYYYPYNYVISRLMISLISKDERSEGEQMPEGNPHYPVLGNRRMQNSVTFVYFILRNNSTLLSVSLEYVINNPRFSLYLDGTGWAG